MISFLLLEAIYIKNELEMERRKKDDNVLVFSHRTSSCGHKSNEEVAMKYIPHAKIYAFEGCNSWVDGKMRNNFNYC